MALPASEAFTGASGAIANPPWALHTPLSTVNRDGSGFGQPGNVGQDSLETWSAATDAFPNDQYSQFTAKTTGPGNATSYLYLLARVTGTYASGTWYWFWTDGGSDTALLKATAGGTVTTSLATANATTFVSGDVFKLECIGSAIKVYKNGSVILSATDSAITSGQPGMGGWSNVSVASVKFDDWIGDAAGASSTPALGYVKNPGPGASPGGRNQFLRPPRSTAATSLAAASSGTYALPRPTGPGVRPFGNGQFMAPPRGVSPVTATTSAILEALAATDAFAATWQILSASAESGTLADSAAAAAAFASAIAEAGAPVDTVAAAAAFAAATAESATLADTESASAAFAAADAESATLADSAAAAAAFGAAVAESGTPSDTVAASGAFASAIAESLTPVDSPDGNLPGGTTGSMAEAATVADAVASSAAFAAAIAESGTPAESAAATRASPVAVTEAGTVADTPAAALQAVAAIAESTAAADTSTASLVSQTSAMAEAASVAETVSGAAALHVAIVESVAPVDAVNWIGAVLASIRVWHVAARTRVATVGARARAWAVRWLF